MKNKSIGRQTVFILITACLFLFSCSNVQIDNTLDYTLQVEINGELHEVPPGVSQGVKLAKGTHKILIKGVTGQVLADTSFTVINAGVINAGQSEYVIWTMLYGMQSLRDSLLQEDWVEMDSVEYFGDFKLIKSSQIFIEKSWDHGLSEDFPQSQKLVISDDYSLIKKLFREADFKKTYNRLSDQ